MLEVISPTTSLLQAMRSGERYVLSDHHLTTKHSVMDISGGRSPRTADNIIMIGNRKTSLILDILSFSACVYCPRPIKRKNVSKAFISVVARSIEQWYNNNQNIYISVRTT